MAAPPSIAEIFLAALRLGCTSFGGPAAHLGYFRKEYVERRRWLDDAHFADLVALCQFLPGPGSSQTGFAVGYLQRGLAGAVAAWVGFTLPSAVLMIAFAYGVAAVGPLGHLGWLQGLKTAAVAVVAQAVWAMAGNLCPDRPRASLALGAAIVLLLVPGPWSQVGVIALGAVLGWWWFRGLNADPSAAPAPDSSRRAGAIWLAIFFLLLLGLPVLARMAPSPWIAIADRFYRVGSLVFGGGHVVLPLLEREVVAPGWLTHDQFLAGYGAAQALPGPLFTLSAFLGAVMHFGAGGWLGGLWALLGIFVPGLLLVLGVLPFWQTLRHQPAAQAALRGANAAVVGVLFAALYQPVWTTGITGVRTLTLALAAFAALQVWKVAPWAVVLLAAILGQVFL
ncbi:MAG TPA: chromate efflux transporter [Opitutaceae bacterium]|nr:chromate efflux transporter [Opitutaceae bacterium]